MIIQICREIIILHNSSTKYFSTNLLFAILKRVKRLLIDYNVKYELRVPLETERVLSIQIPSGN